MEHGGDRADASACGPTILIRRLRERFAPGGMLHYGQGKWYPGESLPRWAFGLYWRKDGKPIWNRRRELIAGHCGDERRNRSPTPRSYSSHALAERLGVDAEYALPAYEDPAHWIVKEGAIFRSMSILSIRRSTMRKSASRMMRVFERGLTNRRALSCRSSAGMRAPESSVAVDIARSGRCGAASCSWCRAIRRSATGCPWRLCPSGRKTTYPFIHPQDPLRSPREPLPEPGHFRQHSGAAARRPADTRAGVHRAVHRSKAPCAPRFRSSRATASLRLHAAGRDAGGLSRTARGGRGERRSHRACRCISKAIRRHSIRAST